MQGVQDVREQSVQASDTDCKNPVTYQLETYDSKQGRVVVAKHCGDTLQKGRFQAAPMCSQCRRLITPVQYCTQQFRVRIHKIEAWLLANHVLLAALLYDEKTARALNANAPQQKHLHTTSTSEALRKVCGGIDHISRHLDDSFRRLKDSVIASKRPLNANMPRDSIGGNTNEATDGWRSVVHTMQQKAVEVISLLLEAQRLYADLKGVISNIPITGSKARGDTSKSSGNDDDCEDNTLAGPYGTISFRKDIELARQYLQTREDLNFKEAGLNLLKESEKVCDSVDRKYTELLAKNTPSPETTEDLINNLQELHQQMYDTYKLMSVVGPGKLVAPDDGRVL